MQSAIYTGRVMHVRQRHVRHRFSYDVTSLLIDLDELPEIQRRLRVLRIDRRGPLSFRQGDHGARDGSALRPWITSRLAESGIDIGGGRVQLLCFPRILGYVFNPLSIWFCYQESGRLAAILYEVSNTFGQHHGYLIPVDPEHRTGAPIRHGCDKAFYVSPFLPMDASYTFRLREPGDSLSIGIRHQAADGSAMSAVQTGKRRTLTDRNLLGVLRRQPGLTFKIMGAIHWEAFHLWRKGARFHRRPQAPEHQVSHISPKHEAAE